MISPITDHDLIRAYLSTDADYAAYALGDLDPPYADHAQWFAATDSGKVTGLALHYPVLDPPVLFLMGDEKSLETLLTEGQFPNTVYYTAKPEFGSLLAQFYTLHDIFHMYRMRVDRSAFAPCEAAAYNTINLTLDHADAVLQLLSRAAEADDRAIHDIAFAPDMISDGYYFGVFQGDRLIAAAGTHLVAKQSKIAAVGNVVVDPSTRNQGLGTLVTSAVTSALLLDSFQLIVLNVRQDNAAAITVYRKLGFNITGKFIEGLTERSTHPPNKV